MKSSKITSLQGMRALALASVILYHFLYRWESQHPDVHYPSFFGVGHFGVQIFFMISGFVIHISLQHANSIWDFYLKRVSRLIIPAVILLPLVTIVAKFSLVGEFNQNAKLSNLVPSILLFDPRYLNVIFHTNLSWVTGVLWTLTIEIWFYFVSGLLFFAFGAKKYLGLLCLFAFTATFVDHFTRDSSSGVFGLMQTVLDLTGFPHFWWFVIGVIASLIYKKPTPRMLTTYSAVCLLTMIFTYNGYKDESEGYCVYLAVCFIFLAELTLLFLANRVAIFEKFLGMKFLTVLGDNSYEFYLIHETVGVSLIAYFCSKFHTNFFTFSLFVSFLCGCLLFAIILIRKFVIRGIESRISNLLIQKVKIT